MKYTLEVEINQPVNKVVELFTNEDNLFKWMKGLHTLEHLNGKSGEKGATTKMILKKGNREIEMLETIITNQLPEEFSASYEAKGVYNLAKISFIPVSESKTRYFTEQEFQFKGFMNVFGLIMPGVFKKQTLKYLNLFKAFAEEN